MAHICAGLRAGVKWACGGGYTPPQRCCAACPACGQCVPRTILRATRSLTRDPRGEFGSIGRRWLLPHTAARNSLSDGRGHDVAGAPLLLVQVFQQMDNTGNGSISIAEYRSAVASQTMLSFFEYLDAQGVADGEVTLDEWLKGMGALGANLNDAQFMKELKKLLSLVVNTGAFPPSAGASGRCRTTVDVATPTIERCVAELSEAVEGAARRRDAARGLGPRPRRLPRRRAQAAQPGARRRGPRRGARPRRSASSTPARPPAARAARRARRSCTRATAVPPPPVGVFTEAEAEAIVRRVAAGAVCSGGTRLALVGREGGGEGDDALVVVRAPAPPAAVGAGEATRRWLDAARQRGRGGGAAGARRRAAAAAAAAGEAAARDDARRRPQGVAARRPLGRHAPRPRRRVCRRAARRLPDAPPRGAGGGGRGGGAARRRHRRAWRL